MAHFFVKLHIVCNIKQFLSRNHWKILHLTDFFYTTSGCDGCDKYEVWLQYNRSPVTGQNNINKPTTLGWCSRLVRFAVWKFLAQLKPPQLKVWPKNFRSEKYAFQDLRNVLKEYEKYSYKCFLSMSACGKRDLKKHILETGWTKTYSKTTWC